jgi:MFS family permease
VLRDRRYALLVLTQAAFSMSMMALNFAMPIYATQTLALPGWVAGALFTINTVMVGFGQGVLVRSLTGRVRNRVLLVANLAFAASYLVLLGATRTSVVVATLLVLGGAAVYTLGEMLGGPVLAALAAECAPEHLRGRYLAWNQMAWTVTGAAAPVTFAALLSQGAAVTWLALTALAGVGCLLTLWLGRVLPHAARPITNGVEDEVPASDPETVLADTPVVG